MNAPVRLGLITVLLLQSACLLRSATAQRGVDVLVIAPHPDDEVLMAGGSIERAIKAGLRVAVILVTNGDATCERDGYLREGESVTALNALGVDADDIHFLGYPDGALSTLGTTALGAREHRDSMGQCIGQRGTYADRTAGRLDEHSRRTGAPAEWTAEELIEDLAALCTRLAPREVYLPHGIDEHPDHAMTYVFFRRALDRLPVAPALVYRSIVHVGPCWPSDCEHAFTPKASMPPLPAPYSGYSPTLRVPIDAQHKLRIIGAYRSQLSPWLMSFARSDEVFFTESYVRDGTRWVRTGGRPAAGGAWVIPEGEFEEWTRWGERGFMGVEVKLREAVSAER